MRDQLIKALLAHAQGDIQKHVANVEVYLANPVGIGEHSNIVGNRTRVRYDCKVSRSDRYHT